MAGFSVKRIEGMEGIGPRGVFKRARGELGVTAFGIAVIEMPPHADGYPEHSHAEDGQEEVYTALRGSGEIEIEGERHRIDPDTMVRVGPGVTRKVWTGEDPLRLLIIGAAPGKVYEPPEFSKLGAPDPTRASAP